MKPKDQTELMPAEGAMVRQPEQAIAMRDPESILRFAMEKGAGVDVIERMMVVRKELMAEQAKAAFDAAMRDFQAEMPIITKGREVPDASGKVAYRYAPLEEILGQVRPLLQRHGFSFTLDTDTDSKDGWVIAKCVVTHCAGHSRESTAKFPLGAGTRIMSTTQVYASALTFASRRVFCNSFGIVTGGEDQDGQTAKPKPQGPSRVAPQESSLKSLAQELWTLLRDKRGPEANWKQANQFMWDEGIIDDTQAAPELTADEFASALKKARAKLA